MHATPAAIIAAALEVLAPADMGAPAGFLAIHRLVAARLLALGFMSFDFVDGTRHNVADFAS